MKPRLAIGPKGNHNPETPDLSQTPNQTGESNSSLFGAYFVNAAYKPQGSGEVFADNSFKPDFAKAVKLAPKQTIEIEIPVEQATNFGLTFMAASDISATLFNDKGAIVGKNLTKTPESAAWFRSIFVDKDVTNGTWKLKLENTSDRDLEAVLTTWKDAVK